MGVERVFRISKGTLEMYPMFHFTERRIEAHVCTCFIVCKIYKELERLVGFNKIAMSVDHVLDAAKTITTIRIKMPENGSCFTKTLFCSQKKTMIAKMIIGVTNTNVECNAFIQFLKILFYISRWNLSF